MNNKIDFISSKADSLINLLKGDNHGSRSSTTIFILLGFYFFSAIGHFIKYGFDTTTGFNFLLLGSIIALTIIMVIYRTSMQTAIKQNQASANYESFKEVDSMTYLKTKLQYLYSGVMVKLTRTKAIRVLYMVMFPFILMLIKEFFHGRSASWIGWAILAIIMGAATWYAYFRSDLDDLEISRDDIKSYMEGI